METVDKLEQMVRAEHPDTTAPVMVDKEEHEMMHMLPERLEKPKREKLVHPYTEMQRAEEARRKESQPKERWPRDGVDDKTYILATALKTEKDAGAAQKAVAEYRTRLKNICLMAVLKTDAVTATTEIVYSRIGKRLLAELLKDDTEAE
jgi:hypothetical protein